MSESTLQRTSTIALSYYIFDPVFEDKTITVVTKDAPAPQGKTYIVKGTVKRNGNPVENITLELRSTLKTDVTDKDGTFTFDDVTCGKHSLTAIENGKIVGYTEFVLSEGGTIDFYLSDAGVYIVTADQNEVGIDLTLNLKDDSTISIKKIDGVKEGEPIIDSDNPQTGDTSNSLLWISLLLVSELCMLGTMVYKRKTGNRDN